MERDHEREGDDDGGVVIPALDYPENSNLSLPMEDTPRCLHCVSHRLDSACDGG